MCVGDDGVLNIAVQNVLFKVFVQETFKFVHIVLPAILMHFGKLKGKLHLRTPGGWTPDLYLLTHRFVHAY